VDHGILADADRRVTVVGLDQGREHRRNRRRQIVRIKISLGRHRHVDRLRDAADQRFVVAQTEATRSRAAVGNIESFQQRRHVQFHKRVVVETLVTEIQHKLRADGFEIGRQRGVIVEKTEAVIAKFAQRRLEPLDRLEILLAATPAALDRIGQPRVAEDHGDVGNHRRAARQELYPIWRLTGQEQPVRHHSEILIARGIRRQQRVERDICETGAEQQRLEALFRVEPLGVELIGNDAALGVDHNFTTDQPIAVTGKIPLAADEMVLIDPLP